MKVLAFIATALAMGALLAGCGGDQQTIKRTDPIPNTIDTPSGLQYQDIKIGSDAKPIFADVVTVNYILYLSDGTKVDSSTGPFEITIGRDDAVAGLDEALLTMKVGGQRRIIVPPYLGYGSDGKTPSIPGDATLIYYVELLGIKSVATTTASGLKYVDLDPGTGEVVAVGDTVKVNYTGWLTDGTLFDTSLREDGQPLEVPVGAGAVIVGFDEGLVGMKVGGKRRLIIPPALGYGSEGSPPDIPGNATLIFEIEIMERKAP